MDIHKNARLTPHGRERLAKMILGGQTPEATGEAVGSNETRGDNGGAYDQRRRHDRLNRCEEMSVRHYARATNERIRRLDPGA